MPVDVDEALLQDVRLELQDTDNQLDAELIEHHANKAKRKIERQADSTANEETLRDAIALKAAIRFATMDKSTFLSSKGAANVDKSWNVEEFISKLEAELEEDLEEIRPPEFVFKTF